MANWVQDAYVRGDFFEDRTSTGAIEEYNFTAPSQLIVIVAKGLNQVARADPFEGTPSATRGIICDDGVPAYLPCVCGHLKIFAPVGMVLSVCGYRY